MGFWESVALSFAVGMVGGYVGGHLGWWNARRRSIRRRVRLLTDK